MVLLRAQEVRDKYGLSRQALYRYEQQGVIQPVWTGNEPGTGQRRYVADEIDALSNGQAMPQQAATIVTPGGGSPQQLAYREFGVTGLRQFGGHVIEERLREMQGEPGAVLLRQMRVDDPVIAAVFFGLVNSLRQASMRIAPASESEADKEAAEHIESSLFDMSWSWSDQFTLIVEPMFEQGFSWLEVVYKRRLGKNPPPYCLDPAASLYDDGRVGWRKWAPRRRESLAEGEEWVFDRHGGVLGVRQQSQYGPDTNLHYIPIQKSLHFRTTIHPANNPEGMPIHRPAYIPWYYTQNMQEIEGIGVERNVSGLPVIYLGRDRSLDGTNSDYELSKNLVTNVRMDEQMGIVFPGPKMTEADGDGFLFELVSPQGRLQWDINQIIERYDKRKALVVLAQFIMLGMDRVGSFALSKHQGDLFTLAAEAWLTSIADVINRHAIPPLIDFNVFPGRTGYPKMVFDSVGVPNLEGIAEYVNKLVDKEVLTPDAELERHLRQVAGLPQKPITVQDEDMLELRRSLQKAIAPLAHIPSLSDTECQAMLAKQEEDEDDDDPGHEGEAALLAAILAAWRLLVEESGIPDANLNQALQLYRYDVEAAIDKVYKQVWQQTRGEVVSPAELEQVALAALDSNRFLRGFVSQLQGELSALDTPQEREDLLARRKSRAMMYAGGAWGLYITAKTYRQDPESLWVWEGGLDSHSCDVCLEEAPKPPRPLREMRLPVLSTTCKTRCRHNVRQVS